MISSLKRLIHLNRWNVCKPCPRDNSSATRPTATYIICIPMLPDVNACGEGTRQPTADIGNWPGNERWNTRPISTKARMRSFYRISDGSNLESLARVARKYQIPIIKITSGLRFALVGMKKEDLSKDEVIDLTKRCLQQYP